MRPCAALGQLQAPSSSSLQHRAPPSASPSPSAHLLHRPARASPASTSPRCGPGSTATGISATRQAGSSRHWRTAPASSCRAASSRAVMAAAASSSGGGADDLLVVGPGVLGSYAGKLWKDAHPGAVVVGLTNTASNHDRSGMQQCMWQQEQRWRATSRRHMPVHARTCRLRKMGLEAATKDGFAPGRKFAHVLFSAPPSGADDYAAEVRAGALLRVCTAAGLCAALLPPGPPASPREPRALWPDPPLPLAPHPPCRWRQPWPAGTPPPPQPRSCSPAP